MGESEREREGGGMSGEIQEEQERGGGYIENEGVGAEGKRERGRAKTLQHPILATIIITNLRNTFGAYHALHGL